MEYGLFFTQQLFLKTVADVFDRDNAVRGNFYFVIVEY